jgi:hypothetical protein
MTREETKVILKLMNEMLRQTAEQATAAHEMAWRTYMAMVRLNPDFQKEWARDKGASFEKIQSLSRDIAATHARIAERLQD